jgi:hypothetical protein
MKTIFKKGDQSIAKFIGSITFATLLILLSGSTVFAGSAVLQLSTPHQQNVVVELNRQKYFSDCEITLSSLRAGQHRLKVYTEQACGPRQGRGRLLYNGFITLENRAKTIASIHPNGGLCIDDVLALGQTMHQPQYHNYPHGNRDRTRLSYNENPSVCQDMGYNSNNGIFPMSNGAFEQLLQRIKRETWSDDRMDIAKQAVRQKQLSSHQVRELLRCFTFGEHQLELAKFAFPHVLDPHRYEVVVDELQWSSHRRELRNFMAR